MTALVLLTAGALVVTKALDCLTTLRHVDASTETHPLARGWMARFGVPRTVLGVFVLSLATVLACLLLVLSTEQVWIHCSYVLAGTLVAAVQAAVAHTNATGSWNVVTRQVARIHARVAERAASRG